MARMLEVVAVMAIGAGLLLAVGRPAAATDEILLRSGGRVQGELEQLDPTLRTPQGAYQISRERVWRIGLGAGAVDVVDLRNGDRLSGVVERTEYALRLPGGTSRTFPREEIALITLGPASAGGPPRLTDVVILKNGDHVYGDMVGTDFDLGLPTGSQHFRRDALWRLDLDSAAGDSVWLLTGTLLSGTLEHPRYEIRAPDGQVLAFGRDEVKAIVFRPPEKPRAAASAGGGPGPVATATPATGVATAAVTPAAVPPPVRAALRDLQFEFDRWDLTAESRRTLEQVAGMMKAYSRFTLLIEGHADERGTAEYNLALASRRAQTARDYLISLGIEGGRLEMISYGEERPLDPRHNEMAWTLNRRAHFVVRAP